MSDEILGTPIICKSCGFEDKVRLFKGIKIKWLSCRNCGKSGTMTRNTEYDKERRKKASK